MIFDFLASGVVGSALGGLFRLAPEVLKFFDRKEDRKHELEMFRLQTDLERTRGEYKLDEKYLDYSVAQTNAIADAFKAQSEEASKSYKWVSAVSALVRPSVTYTLFGMYVVFKFTLITYALNQGVPWMSVVQNNWTPDDVAMLNMILTFWFLGRPLEKRTKGS